MLESDESFEESSDDEWTIEDDGDDDYPIAKAAGRDPTKPPERRKVEIQILHMSDQSQQMVHNSKYNCCNSSDFCLCRAEIYISPQSNDKTDISLEITFFR